MSNKSGAKGAKWEMDLVNGLREHGFDVERLRLSGILDEGDLAIRHDGKHIVVEAKAEQRIDLPGYLRELAVETEHYGARRRLDEGQVEGVVIVKARGKNWKDGYVVRTVRDYFGLDA